MTRTHLQTALDEWKQLLDTLATFGPVLDEMAAALRATWEAGGKVMFVGNGGSAADAMHFAEELVVRYKRDRRPLAAIALCDPAMITCCGNDFGYDRIFERQVEALGRREDLLVAITTSGNSPNVLLAIDAARAIGMKTAAWLGKDGGRARGRCDIEVLIPSQQTARVQEAHKLLYHALCEWVDEWADAGAAGESRAT